MAYSSWSVVFGEQPSAAKWNILGSNDASFNDGTGIATGAITATKIDWASTGANAGIWWEELGRTTLGSAGDTISVASLPTRKYIRVQFSALPSGVIQPQIRFNNDSGNNYNYRYLLNYASASGAVSQSSITVDPGSTASETNGEIVIVNIAAQEKLVTAHVIGQGTAGAANQATSIEVTGKWANTAAAISRIDLVNIGGAGDFATGSAVIVLGHN